MDGNEIIKDRKIIQISNMTELPPTPPIPTLPLPPPPTLSKDTTTDVHNTTTTIPTPLSKSNSPNELSDKNGKSSSTTASSSAQIQALSKLEKQLRRASFQLLMESEGGKDVSQFYNEKKKEIENKEKEEKSVENPNSYYNRYLNRSRSLGNEFKPKYKERLVKSKSHAKLVKKNPASEVSATHGSSSKSDTTSNSTPDSSGDPMESSKKSGIVGILKTTNNTIRNDSEGNRDGDTNGNAKNNDNSTKKNKSLIVSVFEKYNGVNTNSVRFALDDDTSSRGSLDEFDIKGMNEDSMDQIANLLINGDGEMNFENNYQLMYHKQKYEECVNELCCRIGENQVLECFREDTIEINTYSWSDLSFKRTSIRILIDIIKHTFVRNIILKDCRFSDLAAKCIAMAVEKNPFVKRLDITFCSKWARTQDSFNNFLSFDSSRNDTTWVLSKLVGPKAASAFANMLQVNKTLKILQLRNASFGDTGVALIAKALQTNNVLEYLEINNCCTSEYGSHALADALKVNQSLQYLNLSQNPLSDRGGIAIVNALQENHSLKALLLHRCALSSTKFCDSFCKTLSENTSLIEIDIGSNSFSKDSIKYIAEGLSHNSTLTVLKMEDCNLNKKCVSVLSKALDSEQNKTELYLGSISKSLKKETLNKRILYYKE